MLARFTEHTRFPSSLIDGTLVANRSEALKQGRSALELEKDGAFSRARLSVNGSVPGRVQSLFQNKADNSLPPDVDDVIDTLRFEKYIDNSMQGNGYGRATSAARKIYYSLRPLFPVA